MSRCEFVYEADPVDVRLTGGMGGQATLRCTTHDCTWIIAPARVMLAVSAPSEEPMCVIGRIEALEERIVKLEHTAAEKMALQQRSIDELGNPFSLRILVKPEGD
jgi:hypothetical protein